jgi:hypothetical protein
VPRFFFVQLWPFTQQVVSQCFTGALQRDFGARAIMRIALPIISRFTDALAVQREARSIPL